MNELNHSVVTKLGRSHGRSIGSRLANHTLGAPKPSYNAKPRRPSVDNENVYIQDDFGFNADRNFTHIEDQKGCSKYSDSSENEDFSDFQTAAGINVNVDELFPKCHPKTKSQDFLLKESAIRSDSGDEGTGKNSQEELWSLDSPTHSKQSSVEIKDPDSRNALPLIAPPPSKPSKELMSIEEDKYSALRLFDLENTKSSVTETSLDSLQNTDADDFGDFVSADDLFAEIAVRSTENCNSETNIISNNSVQASFAQNAEFLVDDWGSNNVFQSSVDSQKHSLFESNMPSDAQNRLDNLSTDLSELTISKEVNELLPNMDSSTKWNFDFGSGEYYL